ncbi:type IV pilin protein [Kaarinaea lacus]
MLNKEKNLSNQSGFTLVELMIAVVVVSILAMVAIPAYNDSVTKGRRADAKSTLTTMAARQEQFFMDNKRYTADLKELGYASASGVDSIDGYYLVTSVVNDPSDPPAFTLTAAPKNVDADCAKFTLNEKGTQDVTGPKDPELCW